MQNTLSRLQWFISLFFLLTGSAYGLVVDFSATPSSGTTPLFVTLSTRNHIVPSSGFVVSGYQWQLNGPTEASELAGVAEQVVQLNKTGTYTITLTVTEFSLQNSTTQLTNTASTTKTVTVSSPDNDNNSSPPKPSITNSSNQSSVKIGELLAFKVINTASFPQETIYTWNVNPSTNTQILQQNLSTTRIIFNQAGDYQITATTNNQTSPPVTITVTPSNQEETENEEIPPEETDIQNLSVDFSITPSSGSAPLFVTLSTRNQIQTSPGFVVSGYQWQLVGPTETSELSGVAEQVMQLNLPGSYTITLTVTEFALQDGTKQVINTGTATKTILVSFPDEAILKSNKENAEFKGGIFILDELLSKNSELNSDSFVDVMAEMTTDLDDPMLDPVNIYIVAEYKPEASENSLWFMKDIDNFKAWDLDFSLLLPAEKAVTFDENKKSYVSIFSGSLSSPGEYKIYIGYDLNELELDMERAIYTTEPISFTVVPE
jgi:hypothetical protein